MYQSVTKCFLVFYFLHVLNPDVCSYLFIYPLIVNLFSTEPELLVSAFVSRNNLTDICIINGGTVKYINPMIPASSLNQSNCSFCFNGFRQVVSGRNNKRFWTRLRLRCRRKLGTQKAVSKDKTFSYRFRGHTQEGSRRRQQNLFRGKAQKPKSINPGRVENQESKHKETKSGEHVHTKATMTIWQGASGNTGCK